MTKTIATVALIAAAASAASAQNLLDNAGFETGGFDPWYAAANAPFVTTDEAHTGTYSAAALGSDRIRQDFAAFDASLITEVSVWVKRAGGAFNSYSFFYDDGSEESHLINDIGGGDDWKQHDLTANLNASKNLNGFAIYGTSSGPAYMDDFVITPAPATAAMLGLGALFTSRRRR